MSQYVGVTRLRKLIHRYWVWIASAAALTALFYAVRSAGQTGGEAPVVSAVAAAAWPAGGRLFLGSVGLAACATALALPLAFVVGIHLGTCARATLAAVVLVPLAVPPHIGAYVWRFTLEDVAGVLMSGAAWWRSPTWRFLGAAWTLAALYWPVMALPIALGMTLRGNRVCQELATLAPPGAVFWRAVVPGLAPGLAAGAGVFFLLALPNYGVPLMWNVPSQNVAIFARLVAYRGPLQVLGLSLPLVATALLLCVAGLVWFARRPYGLDLTQVDLPAVGLHRDGWGWSAALTGVVLAATVALPLAALLGNPGVATMVGTDLVAGFGPYVWGLVLAALGATGATATGMGVAEIARRAARVPGALIEVVGLCALFMPAAVLCMALAGVLSRPGWAGAFYDSLAVFVVAYGLRFFYIPWKALQLVARFEGRGPREVARVLGLGPLARARVAVSGVLRPALCVSWLVVFVLVLGELEIATFLVQPGRQPASVFLDNLMHYGRSAAVVQWSLALVCTEVAVAWLVLRMGLSGWRKSRVVA